MNYLKTNPVGVDKVIDGLQRKVYDYFNGLNVSGFPRVYDVEIKDKVIPAYYKEMNDYQEVLLDDNKDATFFFRSNNQDTIKRSLMESEIDVIIMVDLNKVKPNATSRPDEEVKLELLNVISKQLNREEIRITKGDDALSGYNTVIKSMQPYFLLKYSFTKKYTL